MSSASMAIAGALLQLGVASLGHAASRQAGEIADGKPGLPLSIRAQTRGDLWASPAQDHLSFGARAAPARTSRLAPVGRFTVIDLLRGDTVCDGTRTDATGADVAVHGGRIAEVGNVTAQARRASSTWAGWCTGFVPVQTHHVAQSTGPRSARR